MLAKYMLVPAAVALGGCSGNDTPAIGAGDGGTSSPQAGPSAQRACTDAKGATSSCAVDPKRDECALGDAKDCMVLTLEEVTVGSEGPCLRVVYENRCGQVVYTDTRIEHTTKDRGLKWQAWTSTTVAGASMDVAQCGATGRYTNIATTSDSKLDVLLTQCAPPK